MYFINLQFTDLVFRIKFNFCDVVVSKNEFKTDI